MMNKEELMLELSSFSPKQQRELADLLLKLIDIKKDPKSKEEGLVNKVIDKFTK